MLKAQNALLSGQIRIIKALQLHSMIKQHTRNGKNVIVCMAVLCNQAKFLDESTLGKLSAMLNYINGYEDLSNVVS